MSENHSRSFSACKATITHQEPKRNEWNPPRILRISHWATKGKGGYKYESQSGISSIGPS